ncbi:MAG: hypothetical protein U9Q08_03945 [Candidatus Omnitrophota bacterium]|nr:hypothetical protein [Candidatus Omnitrophota bacterium]
MVADILGTIWVLLGLLWIIKPRMLRNRLAKKMNRKMRWIVYGFIIMLAFSLLGVVMKAQGIPLKIAGSIGILIAVKGILTVKSKASEKIAGFWTDRPLVFFRIWGGIILVSGVLLILS